MKKIYLFLIAFSLFQETIALQAKHLKNYKDNKLNPTQALLQNMKSLIHEKRIDIIKELEGTRNRIKKQKARTLKRATRLGHVKVIFKDGKEIDLQLENSSTFLGVHSVADPKELEKNLEFLINKKIKFNKQNIKIYTSDKLDIDGPLLTEILKSPGTYIASIRL